MQRCELGRCLAPKACAAMQEPPFPLGRDTLLPKVGLEATLQPRYSLDRPLCGRTNMTDGCCFLCSLGMG
ncbi:hypothetical protein NDU88_004688 [Pleurodeles waltl]|uniref:Uncharacterized protein n=1 Tax=Pleurodeles waltl TaxID=8319 RepID=A0AAV7UFW9_PLEWA|nr:hypothetical protein NDU88_004688 [Pleurodeles waltl]